MAVRKGYVGELDYDALCNELDELGDHEDLVAIAKKHGATLRQVVGTRRFQHLADARAEMVVFLFDRHPQWSREYLGHFLGCDHSTVSKILRRAGRVAGYGFGKTA